ncbi:barstar family protein [Methanobrevibacter sp.]|uniref:barstar family protein n=1 Tax=Methanobrevibacter sp. TaxID=66852 RepID=UPI0025EE0011|nr:barstar family protein [Methanobrevibacter sp.]MBQ2831353.1 barstar family protein [Methanobrevibacter sp.]
MILDGRLISKEGHDYLSEALNFPDYYGKNLDALYDCLCEIEADIELVNANVVDEDIIDTFKDAASENEFLNFEISS